MTINRALIGRVASVCVLVVVGACGNSGEADTAKNTRSDHTAESAKAAASKTADSDNDGFPDDQDAFPNDDREWSDDNGNGTGDNQEALEAKAKAAAAQARAKARQAKARASAIANADSPTARTWAKIIKNPDSHTGEYHVIYGQITQFDSATGDSSFLADTANRNTMSYGYFDGENTMLTGNPGRLSNFVEDDVFRATVQVKGSFSYDTQIGGNTTVPELRVLKIKRVG